MYKKIQIKDLMYDLLQEPSKEKFREFLMGNTGEKDNVDFKSEWIEKGSLSKLLLALGNSGGGIVVFGVKENEDGTIEPIGLNTFLDNADIDDRIKKFVPTRLKYQRLDFSFDSSEYAKIQGKKFQVIQVENNPEALPYVSLAETKDLEKDTIYIRRGTKCEKVKAEELERIINRRIDTQYSSSSTLELEEHLKQLKILYGQIEKVQKVIIKDGGISLKIKQIASLLSFIEYECKPNPVFPEEDYDQFINRMIKYKKIKVEKVLDLK